MNYKIPLIYNKDGSLAFTQHRDVMMDMKWYGISEYEINKYIQNLYQNRYEKLKRILNENER